MYFLLLNFAFLDAVLGSILFYIHSCKYTLSLSYFFRAKYKTLLHYFVDKAVLMCFVGEFYYQVKYSFILRQTMLEVILKATRVTTVVEIWSLFLTVANTFLSGNYALWFFSNYTA